MINDFSTRELAQEFPTQDPSSFSDEKLIEIFHYIKVENDNDKLLSFIDRIVSQNFFLEIIPIIVEMNDFSLFIVCWSHLFDKNRKLLFNEQRYGNMRKLPSFSSLVKKAIEEYIFLAEKHALDIAFIEQLYNLSNELFDAAVADILSKNHLKHKFLFYIATILIEDKPNAALNSILNIIIRNNLFFKRFTDHESARLDCGVGSTFTCLFSIMLTQHTLLLFKHYASNDEFLKEILIEVFQHVRESSSFFMKVLSVHVNRERFNNLLLTPIIDRNSNTEHPTLAEYIFSALTNDNGKSLSYLKNHFAVSDQLMALLIVQLRKALLSQHIINNKHLVYFFIDILKVMPPEYAKKSIHSLCDTLPSGNAETLIYLCSFGPSVSPLWEIVFAKIENETLIELLKSDRISHEVLQNWHFKKVMINRGDVSLLEMLIEKEHRPSWIDDKVIEEILKLSDDTKNALLRVLLSGVFSRIYTFAYFTVHCAEGLPKIRQLMGEQEFINLVIADGQSGHMAFTAKGLSCVAVQMISELLHCALTEASFNISHPNYKEFVLSVLSYGMFRHDQSLITQALDIKNLTGFELYGISVEKLRTMHPVQKVKGKEVELPLDVAQALAFDKILKYLIDKYNEVKSSEPRKEGQKPNEKWIRYIERLNHYAKFHNAMANASMRQPPSTDLGAELEKILVINPLPETNSYFTSDRYGKLIKHLVATPTPVLLLRFKEMTDKIKALYDGSNPPHPVKELVHSLEVLPRVETDQLNKQRQESENIINLAKQDNKHSQYEQVLFLSSASNNTTNILEKNNKPVIARSEVLRQSRSDF